MSTTTSAINAAINSAFGSGILNNATGASLPQAMQPNFTQPASTQPTSSPVVSSGSSNEFRAHLDALNPSDVYAGSNAGGIMNILNRTGGIIFPYAPTITFSQSVNYTDLQLVHSDIDYPAYTRTPTCTLQIAGKFTVQNQQEGQYALAVIHFLRTVSKSYFGETDARHGKAGLPPPVLLFSAYGPYLYNKLHVVLKNHSWSFDDTMDTVPITVSGAGLQGGVVRLPALFTITIDLTVVQTPYNMRTQFSFDSFATGALLDGGGYV